MITSNIGRKFLKAYNEKYHTQYDGKTFFTYVFFPLFFDHHNYMMTAGNSPFENPKISWEKMLKGQIPFETKDKREHRFEDFINKVENGFLDASVAWGYPASDEREFQTTSSQKTDIDLPIGQEDVYLSWVGAALGVGVQGGMSILFNDSQVWLDTFEGWTFYRKILDGTDLLRGNQINTWNGQWLAHRYDVLMYAADNPMANFSPFDTPKNEILSVAVVPWNNLIVNMARSLKNQQLLGYIYNFGQTNTTVGFIPFFLEKIRRPMQLYRKLFGIQNFKSALKLWGTAVGLRELCRSGAIGLKAMEPKGLKPYMDGKKLPKKARDEKETVTYDVYKTWILAMLNNEQLWDKSQELAKILEQCSVNKDKALSTKARNAVNNVLATNNKRGFIDAITSIVGSLSDPASLCSIVKDVHEMPTDNVPYFLTLVRFQYAAINNK